MQERPATADAVRRYNGREGERQERRFVMTWNERWEHFMEGLGYLRDESEDETRHTRPEADAERRHRIDLSAGSETLDD